MKITQEMVKRLERMLLHDHHRKTELGQEVFEDKKLSNKDDLKKAKPEDKRNP